ncbi:hypothetical protein [Aquirufa sp.]|jgi:hypothetical protein|uniref:hypothetical protein n=1 Tax=Aquirufa sp. TaxID=2676249 RepID=UPI0037C11352
MKYLLLILGLFLFVGCKSEMDNSIKKGYFDDCQKATVEELVDGFFANPEWESFVSPDDNKYHLNVSGEITYEDKPANAVIQFEINDDKTWEINAFEINGEGQTEDMISDLVVGMCNEADEKKTGK